MKAVFLHCACLLALFASAASALSYLPMSDAALSESAELVVRAEVTAATAAPGREQSATVYELAVDAVFKGWAPPLLRLELPGALDASAPGALIVPGAPRYGIGDRVLLFLAAAPGGGYRLAQLGLGSFQYRRAAADGEEILDPDLPLLDQNPAASGYPARRYRNAARFEAWLRAHSGAGGGLSNGGHADGADGAYWSAAADALPPASRPKYALSDPKARWFEFDQGQALTLHAGTAGLPGLAGGGLSELQEAIAAMNQAPGSALRLIYGGTLSGLSGLALEDGLSGVLFNDPHGDIAGSFSCARGGVAALGQWRAAGTRWHEGQLYQVIREGDIVVQDGIGCLLYNRANTQELLAHELGHILGLAHSCGDEGQMACVPGSLQDEALMRPSMHADGRGAHLNADDVAGLAALYAPVSAAASPPAAAPPPAASAVAAASGGGGALAARALLGLALLGLWRVARSLTRPS